MDAHTSKDTAAWHITIKRDLGYTKNNAKNVHRTFTDLWFGVSAANPVASPETIDRIVASASALNEVLSDLGSTSPLARFMAHATMVQNLVTHYPEFLAIPPLDLVPAVDTATLFDAEGFIKLDEMRRLLEELPSES